MLKFSVETIKGDERDRKFLRGVRLVLTLRFSSLGSVYEQTERKKKMVDRSMRQQVNTEINSGDKTRGMKEGGREKKNHTAVDGREGGNEGRAYLIGWRQKRNRRWRSY